MKILAIETSCDDTGIAVLEFSRNSQPQILANLVSSQVKIHAPWGGVVPTLAKREHQRNLTPLLFQALKQAKLLRKIPSTEFQIPNTPQQNKFATGQESQISNSKFQTLKNILKREEVLAKKLIPFLKKYQKIGIDLIAVTIGPGLEPTLWVGVNFAKALACIWNLPVIPVNHIEAHISAALAFDTESQSSGITNYLRQSRESSTKSGQLPITKNLFPAICLVVSGGHTQLILMEKFSRYQILGETRDDAAGEAFDKLAKMLNLDYPGGPIVAQIANKYRHPERSEGSPAYAGRISPDKLGDSSARHGGLQNDKNIIRLPRPMLNSSDYDFSFSGLKTAALYFVKTLNKKTLKKLTPAICAEFQQAVADVLVSKTLRAAKEFNAKTVLLSGGVAANDLLRKSLSLNTKHLSLNFSVPPKNFCTDNAVMVALTASLKTKKYSWRNIKVEANLKIA